MTWINHHASIIDPPPKKRSRRTFPRVHTFKITVRFSERLRIADAQRIVSEHLTAFGPSAPRLEVTKVARTKR